MPSLQTSGAGLVQVPEGRAILNPLTVAENLELGAWTRVDRQAAELGMSRSSYFGLAASRMLAGSVGLGPIPALTAYVAPAPRTKTVVRRGR